ncbi:glycosyltransferase family 39 protein, partial [bacterium]|nr:glycosyltransferase family 39 protein [bacterium]
MADMTFSIAGGKAVRPALLGAAGATLLGAFVAWDVLFPVLHYGHSTHIDLIRQMAMDAAYEEGQVYPRWAADFYFGRGSPIFNFYAPLAYLIGELFSLLGVSALGAIKGSYFLGVIVAAIAANRLARELWDTASGVAGAALLLLSPYFLLDLYVRGALAELWGMALLALALAFTIRAARTGQTHDATRAGAATALLLYAHNIAALLGVPVIFLAGLVAGDGRTARRRTLTALALGVAMGAAFWAPALFEKGLVRADENLLGGDYDFRRHFVPVRDLLHDEWGYGSPMAGPEPMATTLGALHLL